MYVLLLAPKVDVSATSAVSGKSTLLTYVEISVNEPEALSSLNTELLPCTNAIFFLLNYFFQYLQ